MGVEPFLLSSVLRGVVAQRLVRMLCPHCREAYLPDGQELEKLGAARSAYRPGQPLYRARLPRIVWTRDTGAAWRFMKSCR